MPRPGCRAAGTLRKRERDRAGAAARAHTPARDPPADPPPPREKCSCERRGSPACANVGQTVYKDLRCTDPRTAHGFALGAFRPGAPSKFGAAAVCLRAQSRRAPLPPAAYPRDPPGGSLGPEEAEAAAPRPRQSRGWLPRAECSASPSSPDRTGGLCPPHNLCWRSPPVPRLCQAWRNRRAQRGSGQLPGLAGRTARARRGRLGAALTGRPGRWSAPWTLADSEPWWPRHSVRSRVRSSARTRRLFCHSVPMWRRLFRRCAQT